MSGSAAPKGAWRKQILLFLLSQSITLFGSTLVQMAVIWYVTLQTGSGVWVAAFTVCSYLPQFLISFAGGVWADRYSRKTLIIGADALIALVTLLMALTLSRFTGLRAQLCALLAMSLVRSLGAGVQTPAVGAAVPSLVPPAQLMRYNGINASMQSLVQFAAPAAAGALLSVSSLQSALMVDVLTAAAGVTLCGFVCIPRQSPAAAPQSILADMKAGVRYAFSDALLGRLLTGYGIFIVLSVPAGFLAQLYVSRTYGDTYWYLTAVEIAGFLGMAGGGVLMSAWGGFPNRAKTLAVGLAAFGALAVGMGLSRVFFLYLALMLLYGVALTMVQTAATTMIQENAAQTMQGRVFGLLSAVYSGALPAGMAVFGPLSDVMELRWIMLASGGGLILTACALRLPHANTKTG